MPISPARRFCLATANGTSALLTSLNAMGIEPGDEVIVPPYTFIATVNVVLRHHALPVFVDTDPETFQMDARKIEAAITPRTKAIIPVHLGGSACDLDAILADRRAAVDPGAGGRLPGAPRRVARAQRWGPTARPAASASRHRRT